MRAQSPGYSFGPTGHFDHLYGLGLSGKGRA